MRSKEQSYKDKIASVWEREQQIAVMKQKLQSELGVALNDDKIKAMMGKNYAAGPANQWGPEKQQQMEAAYEALKQANKSYVFNMFPSNNLASKTTRY